MRARRPFGRSSPTPTRRRPAVVDLAAIRARHTMSATDGWCVHDHHPYPCDAILAAERIEELEKAAPEREALVASLVALPDHYFADGIEYGDSREMADEMVARWGALPEKPCDWCDDGNVAVDGYHLTPEDPYGLEPQARIPCQRYKWGEK